MTRVAFSLCVLLLGLHGRHAKAQSSGTILRATVADAQTGVLLTDAEVTVRGLGMSGRTDILGDARIVGVPSGVHIVEARRIGYAPSNTRASFPGKDSVEVLLLLSQRVQRLPTVTVEDSVSPFLREFESRRAKGKGYFVTEKEIHAAHGRDISDFLMTKIPGIRAMPDGRVISTRGPNSIYGAACQVAVYFNGVRTSSGSIKDVAFFDLLGGIEYYTPGFIPVQYKELAVTDRRGSRGGSAACGVMLIWSGG